MFTKRLLNKMYENYGILISRKRVKFCMKYIYNWEMNLYL